MGGRNGVGGRLGWGAKSQPLAEEKKVTSSDCVALFCRSPTSARPTNVPPQCTAKGALASLSPAMASSERQQKTVCFDCSKRELFTPNQGLKALRRKLSTSFKVSANKDTITLATLREASVAVFIGPREKFTAAEFEAMNDYLKEGGSILISLGEEGEGKFATNVNYFAEEYGMAFNTDAVVRTVYYKYLHPKEVHISNGVLNREINIAAGKRPRGAAAGSTGGVPPAISDSSPQANVAFAFPYGCSVTVQKPAFPVLSSGPLAFPLNRPVCALWTSSSTRTPGAAAGRLCLLGSSHMLSDEWVDKDENAKLIGVLMRWLTHGDVNMDPIDAEVRVAANQPTHTHTPTLATPHAPPLSVSPTDTPP